MNNEAENSQKIPTLAELTGYTKNEEQDDGSKKVSDKILNKIKQRKEKIPELKTKDDGNNTDFEKTTETISYVLFGIAAVAAAGLVICALLSMIFFTPIPAVVFAVFGGFLFTGLVSGAAAYLSKPVVDLVQTFVKTKFTSKQQAKSPNTSLTNNITPELKPTVPQKQPIKPDLSTKTNEKQIIKQPIKQEPKQIVPQKETKETKETEKKSTPQRY